MFAYVLIKEIKILSSRAAFCSSISLALINESFWEKSSFVSSSRFYFVFFELRVAHFFCCFHRQFHVISVNLKIEVTQANKCIFLKSSFDATWGRSAGCCVVFTMRLMTKGCLLLSIYRQLSRRALKRTFPAVQQTLLSLLIKFIKIFLRVSSLNLLPVREIVTKVTKS